MLGKHLVGVYILTASCSWIFYIGVMMGETSGLVLELGLTSVTTALAALLEEAPTPSSVLVGPVIVLRKD